MQSFCNEQISVPCCVIYKLAPHGFSRAGPGLPVSRAGPGLPVSRASRLFNYFSSSPGWLTTLLVIFD